MKIQEGDIIGFIRKGNDQKVMEHLYKTVFPKVKKYIVSHNGNADDASDAFQEGIMSLYNSVIKNTYNEKYTPYGYLYTVSINRWFNILRKTSRIQLIDTFEESKYDIGENTTFLQERESKKSLLEVFFSELGERCLDLLKFSIYQSMLMEDIALRMGIAGPDAAKMQLFRCKQKMLKVLEEKPHLKSQLRNSL